MPIKDTFEYAARWDSVGLDCADCQHFSGPPEWPDTARVSRCKLHKISLAIELRANGYKDMEWFCRDFADTGRAFPPAVSHLDRIRQSLQQRILYRFYGSDGYLVEHQMDRLEAGQ